MLEQDMTKLKLKLFKEVKMPNTNFTFVVDRETVCSCIYFVIGGAAKNFLLLFRKVLKFKKRMKALELSAIKYTGILQFKYDLSWERYQLEQEDREQCTPNYTTQRALSSCIQSPVVPWKSTYISEEHVVQIFWVKGKLSKKPACSR